MNICMFSGRIVADAQQRFTQSGVAVTNFRIAVDTGWGDSKKTEFLDCVLWKREPLARHILKGKAVTLSGEYGTREWTDKEGGKRRTTEITVREFEFQQGQPKDQGQQRPEQGAHPGPGFPSDASGMDDAPF